MKAYRESRGTTPLILNLGKQNQHSNDNNAVLMNPIFDTVPTRHWKQNKNLRK